MNETVNVIGEALKSFFDSVGYFFGIDFLSFFVSGAICMGAIAFIWVKLAHQSFAIKELTSFLEITYLLLICYVLGMMCFASGRWVRLAILGWNGNRRYKFENFFPDVIEAHNLKTKEIFKEYLNELDSKDATSKRDKYERLYTRLWTEVRQSKRLAASYALLNRYWFMAATYDGLGMALVVWLLVVGAWFIGIGGISPKLNAWTAVPLGLILGILALVCWREAERYKRYQVEELVATLAYKNTISRANFEEDSSEEK